MTFLATALAFDSKTNDWTKPVEVKFERLIEAKHWCSFNRDWMKSRRVTDADGNVVHTD